MKKIFSALLILLLLATTSYGQELVIQQYSVSKENPYGLLNPDAPKEVGDYGDLIGICDCKSLSRKPDGSWTDTLKMEWSFKYILNGTAVQDETFREDGLTAGSIRQYQADSARWYVHYYSNGSAGGQLSAWEGGMQEEEIILYNEQTAPNGMEGYYKIRFYDISPKGFSWLGVWTDPAESFTYETWKIYCKKRL